MTLDPNVSPVIEYSLGGISLILVWKLLDVVKHMFLIRRENNLSPDQLGYDITMRQRIKDIHAYTEGVQTQIAGGDFRCQWKDRDEVRDFMQVMRDQTTASKAQTQAITELATEMRITRNGNGGS